MNTFELTYTFYFQDDGGDIQYGGALCGKAASKDAGDIHDGGVISLCSSRE